MAEILRRYAPLNDKDRMRINGIPLHTLCAFPPLGKGGAAVKPNSEHKLHIFIPKLTFINNQIINDINKKLEKARLGAFSSFLVL